MNRAAPISVSLAFGSHSCANTVNATVGGWRSGSSVCFTPVLFPEVLNAKQGKIACTIFQDFGMTRLGIEPRPTAYKASIIPPDHFYQNHSRRGRKYVAQIVNIRRKKSDENQIGDVRKRSTLDLCKYISCSLGKCEEAFQLLI